MPNPYAQRIQAQRRRIQHHSGDDSALRAKLNTLRARRSGFHQANQAPAQLPWNAQYESTVSAAGRDYNLQNAQLANQEGQLSASYGFNDPSDPFSRARQLQEGFANANRGTTTNYADAGQLYSGSLTNAHDIDRQNFERAYDAEQKDYQAQLNELAFQRLGAQNDYQSALTDASAQSLEDALNQRVDPAEAPPRRRRRSSRPPAHPPAHPNRPHRKHR